MSAFSELTKREGFILFRIRKNKVVADYEFVCEVMAKNTRGARVFIKARAMTAEDAVDSCYEKVLEHEAS